MIVFVYKHSVKSIFSITQYMILSHCIKNINLLGFHFISFESMVPHCSLRGWYSQIFRSNANQSRCLNFIDVHNWRAFLHFYEHVDVIGPKTSNNVRATCFYSAPAMKIKSCSVKYWYDVSSNICVWIIVIYNSQYIL